MTGQWRIRISGRPRKQPDIGLLVQAVLALGEQLQREALEREQAAEDQQQTADTEERAS
jgi:hypothetical protein